ncbi:Alpha/Beta hydrolase protein [Lentinula aciculospora]|uniref:Alpha/Beta hydrolase protein n=1 Tax=Lentinula aciculospora TaxID=153920 RepID=A0A9W9A1G6_9AGAR|nr:Alpha/Beta hydrolase protein [Lentinula aciculospora]
MIYVQDKRITLPDGRTLAYADNGNTSSLDVILYLHGPFNVGDASRLSLVLQSKNVHLVCPSLPGWGRSSPVTYSTHYASSVVSDLCTLLNHLHPERSNLKLHICAHSFGCIAAQILYGASYVLFPYGRCIAGLILLDPVSPPHCHRNYWRFLSWQSYFLTGPPSRLFPFNITTILAKLAIEGKLQSPATAESFVRRSLLSMSVGGCETEELTEWKEQNGITDEQYERVVVRNAVYSVASTWQGFLEIPQIYHSGWGGFCPHLLDDEHSKPPVTILTSNGDSGYAYAGMGSWLVGKYKNATLRMVEGRSNLSLLLCLDNVWREALS